MVRGMNFSLATITPPKVGNFERLNPVEELPIPKEEENDASERMSTSIKRTRRSRS
jgi:hypothetical protein